MSQFWPLLALFSASSLASIQNQDTRFPMPYYTEVSVCSCDLTGQKCDAYCCCDPDCPREATQNITCMPGLPGGNDTGKIVDLNCSNSQLFDPDYKTFLCIHDHSSPYLGLYYPENVDPEIKTLEIPGEASSSSSASPYEVKYAGSEKPLQTQKEYVYGSEIKTVFSAGGSFFGKLELPAESGISRGCQWSSVRYLKDKSSFCMIPLNEEVCGNGKGTGLDYQMYLIPTPVNVSNVPDVLSRANLLLKAPLQVHYYAAHSSRVYLKRNARKMEEKKVDVLHEILDNSGKHFKREKFVQTLDNGCQRVTLFPNIQNQVHFDQQTCFNVVLEAHYRFYWRGPEILKIEADILLGNVTLLDGVHEIMQFYSSSFHHHKNPTVLKKSGQPGYNPGQPIITGEESSRNNRIQPSDFGLKLWQTVSNSRSLCRQSGLQNVQFLRDFQSGCLLELSRDNFTDCARLQENIVAIQNGLIFAEFVAKGGNLNTTREEFAEIIYRENDDVNPSGQNVCSVDNHVHIEVLYTKSGPLQEPIYRINGVQVNYFRANWTGECWDIRKCAGNVQKYQLASSVSFHEIPIVWHHQNTTRFWIIQDWNYCDRDICWKELMYAFTHHSTGDGIAYATMCALSLTPLGLFIMWFTREFW